MSRSTHLAVVPDDDFDPTRPEGDSVPSADVEVSSQLAAAFAAIPDGEQIKIAAFDLFAKDLPEAVIRAIIMDSEEVAQSTRKILAEHMRMGGNFSHIRTSTINAIVSAHGDSKKTRDRGATLAYGYLENLFHLSKSKIILYIRCYEKFIGNDDAMQILKLTDMQALIAKDTPDDLIDQVIQARKDDPDLSKNDVKQLIASYRQARAQIAEKDAQLEVVTEELNNTFGKLDQAQIDNRRLLAESQGLQRQIDRDRDSADKIKVELDSVSSSVNILRVELANQERLLENAHRELAEARSAVRTESKEVPMIPGDFKKMEDAVEDQIARLREVSTRLEEEQQKLVELEKQRAENEAAIAAARVIDETFEATIERFGDFTKDYHTLQLLVTADGNPTRFQSMFNALTALVGKFRDELVAATQAA